MSGLEIAGVVLGAIPVALELLQHYEDAAKRLDFWRKIQVEYLQCKRELELQALLFKQNLKRLLLPLDLEDTDIERLLADPSSNTWKDPSVDTQLGKRLRGTYKSYLECVGMLQQTMERLKDVLAINSAHVQSRIENPKDPWSLHQLKTRVLDSEWWGYQRYRFKFANSAKERQELLGDLDTYNTKLEKLLNTSDEDFRLSTDRELAIIDERLCSFWIQAARMYSVLANHWDCACRASHTVHICLEQSEQDPTDLLLTWSNIQEALFDSCQVKVSEKSSIAREFERMSLHRPPPRASQPKKSAMKKGKSPVSDYTQRPQPPTIQISTAPTPASIGLQIQEISSMCSSINTLGKGCIGYVLDRDKGLMYYVHRESTENAIRDMPVTLDDLIQAQTSGPPSRLQRCRLSLAIATSFMKLLDTPWMSQEARKSNFVFNKDESHSPQLALEYSLLAQGSPQSNKGGPSSLQFFGPMELLGIVLLELCFWSLLKSQSFRTTFPPGNTEMERRAFDLAAAQVWKAKVLHDSGPDYKRAVDWCFQGHRETSSTQWRREMYRNVIQPLEKCHRYLSGETV